MGKLLLWGLVAMAILIFARLAAHKAAGRQAAATQERRAAASGAAKRDRRPEPMVRCAHCGVHLPYSEAVVVNGQPWCGPEHALLGARDD